MNGVAGPKAPVGKYGQPIVPDLAVRHLCPNCRTDPPNIIEEYSHGDLVCGDCGTILGDRIVDTRSEWRTFAGDEGGDDPSRVGGPSNPLLGHAPLETSISARDGRTGMSRDLQRAQNRANQQATATATGTRSTPAQLQAAFSRINEVCDSMQLPRSIAERAQHAYVIGDEQSVSKGKHPDTIIAACVLFACRAAGAARSFREVGKATKVPKADLGKVFNELRMVVMQEQQRRGISQPQGFSSASESTEGMLGRFCNYLDLGNTIFNASKHIAVTAVKKSCIDGRSPLSIAAGVLYFTCILFENPITPKEISGVAGVSESTIKLITKKIAEDVDKVIRSEWKTQHPEGYRNLASLGKTKEKSSRSATPSQPSAADKDKTKGKEDGKENGSKLKPNGAASNGTGSANGEAAKSDTKTDAKTDAKPDAAEVIVL